MDDEQYYIWIEDFDVLPGDFLDSAVGRSGIVVSVEKTTRRWWIATVLHPETCTLHNVTLFNDRRSRILARES